MRTLALLPVLAVALVAAAGCGSSEGTSTTPAETGQEPGPATTSNSPPGVRTKACADQRLDPPEVVVVGAGCAQGKQTVTGWEAKSACRSPSGGSRYSCTVGGLRCLGTRTERGIAVNCSRPQLSISFTGKAG